MRYAADRGDVETFCARTSSSFLSCNHWNQSFSFSERQKPALKRQRSVIECLEWQTVCWSRLNGKSFKSDMKAHCRSEQV